MLLDVAAGAIQHVGDHHGDHAAHGFVNQAGPVRVAGRAQGLLQCRTGQRQVAQIDQLDEAGAQPIVDVVGVVGDVVGHRRHLCLRRGPAGQLQIVFAHILANGQWQAAFAVFSRGPALRVEQWAVVLHQAFQRFPCQVQAVEAGVTALQLRDDSQGLGVVLETAVLLHAIVQHFLAHVAEGRVAQIVRQRQCLGEILVQRKRAGDGAGDLRHLQRMGESRAEMVAVVGDEHLGLVHQAAEGGGVHDAVAVTLEGCAQAVVRFRNQPPARTGGVSGIWRKWFMHRTHPYFV